MGVFLTLPIDVKIATLAGFTDAKDPDELLKREGGLGVLREAIAGATELMAYRIARLRARLASAGPAQTERAIREEMRSLGSLGLASADKVRWQFVVRRLAELTGLDAETIAELVREEVAATVAGAEDVEAELQDLFTALGGTHGPRESGAPR